MTLSVDRVLFLGILCLTCLPGPIFSQTNPAEGQNSTFCRPTEFQCKSDLCVNAFSLCDGSKDCDDGSDETKEACSSFRCPKSAYRCDYGGCIDKEKLCDGISQCADSSDENPSVCARKSESSKTECGKFDQKTTPLQQQNRGREGSWLPWLALIYQKVRGATFQFECFGTIVSSHAIITGALCIYDERAQEMKDPSLYTVVVGRHTMMKTTPMDQQYEARSMYVPAHYKGVINNYASDIGIILLTKEIEFNDIVRPICLDLAGMYSNFLTPGKSGIVGSWAGIDFDENATLRILSFPYVSPKTCEENIPPSFVPFITYDKFCSGIINVSTVCRGDSGGGFATQFRDGRWYLTGIVSVGVASRDGDLCNTHHYFGLTKVSQHYDFIEEHIKEDFEIGGGSDSSQSEQDTHRPATFYPPTTNRPIARPIAPNRPATLPPPEASLPYNCEKNFACQSGGCVHLSEVCNGVRDCEDGSDEDFQQCGTANYSLSCSYSSSLACKLPERPENGHYSLIGCRALGVGENPGSMVPVGVALTYNCGPGYKLYGSSVLVCNNGWSSKTPTCSKVLCPPLVDPSRDIDCSLNGDDVDCADPGEPGTRATLRCKTHFENVPTLSTYDIICQKNGEWSRQLYSCVPKCGEPNPHGITLIGFGERSRRSEYSWHIGLYKFQKDGSLELHCSGTIVSSRVIVTAAHCFPDDTAKNMDNVLSQYRAVAGKYYREWNKTSKYTQHLDVEKVVLHRRYRGGSRNYVHDIAILILKYQIRIDEAVRPACVDFDKSFFKYFTPGISGKVLGWGWTENQTWSDVILTANLPYVSQVVCEENTPQTFHDFLLGDKFCAGKDRTVVCQGDSGGGYAVRFPHATRWYLVGVVSIGATEECAVYPYAAFTNVYNNLEFVRQYVDLYL